MFTLEIVSDNDPVSPREWDNLGTIYYSSSRYTLGDKCVSKDEIEAMMADKDMIYLPVYAYIHSGIVMNTTGFSCPWDSGMSGIIAVSKDKVREFFKVKRITKAILDKVNSRFKGEVETYSQYLGGEVYCYLIKDDSGDIVDSCGGFYSEEDAQSEGNASLKFYQNKAA
jgi:hypothetical protein